MRALFRRLGRDQRGSTIIEFALVAPVMLVVIMGLLDMTYRLYAKAIFEGSVQKAARDATLESGADVATSTLIDTMVKNRFKDINATVNDSSFSFTRKNFKDFTSAGTSEPVVNQPPNSPCLPTRTYIDLNNNGSFDSGGADGQGGADDVVLYTATVTYRSLFPVTALFGAPSNQTIKASTVLRNQPYNDQAARVSGPERAC